MWPVCWDVQPNDVTATFLGLFAYYRDDVDFFHSPIFSLETAIIYYITLLLILKFGCKYDVSLCTLMPYSEILS